MCVQGHSAAVKEAVGAGLLGCKAPFRLVQDHSRSGRLEASTLALKKWLFSDAFDAYLNLLQVRFQTRRALPHSDAASRAFLIHRLADRGMAYSFQHYSFLKRVRTCT